jgi:hypothetical protein
MKRLSLSKSLSEVEATSGARVAITKRHMRAALIQAASRRGVNINLADIVTRERMETITAVMDAPDSQLLIITMYVDVP